MPQNWLVPQAVPQAPQCVLSVCVSTQCDEQQVSEPLQPLELPS
jgi:hypothetical protein